MFFKSAEQTNQIREYKRLRKLGVELNGTIMGTMPKFVLKRAGRDLGIYRGKTFVFETEEDTTYLMDRAFYDLRWEGKNLIGHFMDSEAYGELTEEQQIVVQGRTTAYYSLFEVVGSDPTASTLTLRDLLGVETIKILDINMSETLTPGLLLATRIQHVHGISQTTGATCPFEEEHRDTLLDGLRRKHRMPDGKARRGRRRLLERSDYSVYFFKLYKKISRVRHTTA